MKFVKTISIEESNLHNIKEIMSETRKTFAEVCRLLIGLGLQKYYENAEEKRTTIITTTTEKETPPPIETIKEYDENE